MGNNHCALTGQQTDAQIQAVFRPDLSHNAPKAGLIKVEENSNKDEGLNPLITTFRDISHRYRSNLTPKSKNNSPSRRLDSKSKSPSKKKPIANMECVKNKMSTTKRTVTEVNQHVDHLLRKGKESKLKIQLKRHEKDFIKIEERPMFQSNMHDKNTLKMGHFLKKQEDFMEKRKASLEKSRQLINSQISEAHTYKPSINRRSKQIIETKRTKMTPINQLIKAEKSENGQEACELLSSASPLKLKQIALDQSKPRVKKTLKLTKVRDRIDSINHSLMGSSARSNRNHLSNKLIKQFNAALQTLNRTCQQKLSYLDFCEIFRLMGMVSRESDCNNFIQTSERALLSEAFNIVNEGDSSNTVQCYSVLSLIMAVCGIDLSEHFSKVCLDCMKFPSTFSRSIELTEFSPSKQPQTTPSKQLKSSASNTYEKELKTPSKDDTDQKHYYTDMNNYDCDTVNTEPMENLLVDSRLNRSMRELLRSRSKTHGLGTRTKYYMKFKDEDISQIQTKFKPFYNTKMSQVKGYSEILPSAAKLSLDRERSSLCEPKKALVNTNALSAKHKNRILSEAVKHSVLHNQSQQLTSVEVMRLEKILLDKQNEQKKAKMDSRELAECTFHPKTNFPLQYKQPIRHLYLYELGKDRIKYREDRPYVQETEECKFYPNLTLTKGFKPVKTNLTEQSSRKNDRQFIQTDLSYRQKIHRSGKPFSQRILEIKIDLGTEQKTINVDRDDNPTELARNFLYSHNLPPILLDRLAAVIEDGIQRAICHK